MNGRCDSDPLDPADDVCDLCGGEFCEACLLWPRGRKKTPVCKPCAIKTSGIRGSAKPERVGSRRDAKQRREVLLQTKDERAKAGFVFFDEADDYAGVGDGTPLQTATGPEPTRRRISLGRRRHHEETEHTEPDPLAVEVPEPGPDPGSVPGFPIAEDPFESASADQEAPSATEMLARIRSHADVGGGARTPEHEASPPSGSHVKAFSGAPEVVQTSGIGFDPRIDPFSLQVDPFTLQVDPFTLLAESQAIPPPPPAPIRHVAPPPPPPPPPPVSRQTPSAAPAPGPAAVPAPDPSPRIAAADHPSPQRPTPPSTDVDANGNWIPPILRGMAPAHERERELLPRRPVRH